MLRNTTQTPLVIFSVVVLVAYAFIVATKRGLLTGVKSGGSFLDFEQEGIIASDSDLYFVFLQKFPLLNTAGLLFHTEVLVCPKQEFSAQDQSTLDQFAAVALQEDFVQIEETWWSDRTVNCVELGYGGSPCATSCCSVPHTHAQLSYPLNARSAVIDNADCTKKTVFLYGTGQFGGESAYKALCDRHNICWSHWAGADYNPFTNNCNTFTSTVLSCVYGLSEKKPDLGPSDMVTVKCHCRPPILNLDADLESS